MPHEWRVTIPSTAGHMIINLDDHDAWPSHVFCYDDANNNTAKSLALAWVSLLADNPIGPLPPALLARFVRRVGTDAFGLIKTYANLANDLMKSEITVYEGRFVRAFVDGFQHTPAFRVYLEWYRNGDPRLLSWLLSFLSFGKVAQFDRPELEPAAFRAWAENEERLKSVEFAPALTSNLKRVIAWLLEGFKVDLASLTPHHGPGNTAERVGRGKIAKNYNMMIHRKLDYRFFHRSAYSLFPDFQGYYDFSDSPAELTFVRKDYKSLRTINMLPIDVMYISQGIRDQMYEFFEHGRISEFVTLRDQRNNQIAARKGSERNKIDTIDLSSASDLVKWLLIKSTFPTSVLVDLAATRLSKVRYHQLVFTLEKYAPMGDATCFPVQCIVFTAVVIATGLSQALGQDLLTEVLPDLPIETLYNQSFSKRERDPRNRYASPTVYGDDICLDNRLTSNVMRNLESMGFKVNVGKSFIGPDTFRESCGKFYSKGTEVHLLKYRGGFKSRSLTIGDVAGVIDQANHAYAAGFYNLYRYYVQLALYVKIDGIAPQDCGRNPILFSNMDDEVLAIKFTPDGSDRNRHLRRYVDKDLQTSFFQSVGLAPSGIERDVQSDNDHYHYLQWQRARWYGHNESPSKEAAMRADYRGVVPVFRWTRVSEATALDRHICEDVCVGTLDVTQLSKLRMLLGSQHKGPVSPDSHSRAA